MLQFTEIYTTNKLFFIMKVKKFQSMKLIFICQKELYIQELKEK